MIIFAKDDWKHLRSKDENYSFNMKDGTMVTWGRTKDEDVKSAQFGPYILDIEVSEVCNGIPSPGQTVATPCAHCYKSNTKVGRNMSFDTFKNIFDVISGGITKVTIYLEDGTQHVYDPNFPVLLTDGSTKIASKLTYDDDIA